VNHVQLSTDAQLLNRVMNDPSVFPDISFGHPGPFDGTPLLKDGNYFFANEHGGFLLIWNGSGVYDVHTQFLPEGRGKRARLAALEVQRFMFTETDCVVIRTDCPHGNDKAVMLALWAGMRKTGTEEQLGVPCDVYAITREEWLCRQ
jgi:hypothetical protein